MEPVASIRFRLSLGRSASAADLVRTEMHRRVPPEALVERAVQNRQCQGISCRRLAIRAGPLSAISCKRNRVSAMFSTQTWQDRRSPSPVLGRPPCLKRAIALSTSRVTRDQTLLSKSLASQSSTWTAPGQGGRLGKRAHVGFKQVGRRFFGW